MRLYLSSFRIGNRPEELLRLLAGPKQTALIVNADDYKSAEDRAASLEREIDELNSLGLEPTEIDLRRYFDKADELKEVLSGFDLIYVRGGQVFVLRRAFRQSGADEIIRELLANDAIVYAGYSAGICMLGPTLHGYEITGDDDPDLIPEGYQPSAVWEGLSVLPYVIVPHYGPQDRFKEWADKAVEYYVANHIPFIVLCDGEATVVDANGPKVVG